MSETQAEYQAGNEPDITYRCPRCGERLGHFVGLDNGGRILLIGGMIVLYSHGICGKCGKERKYVGYISTQEIKKHSQRLAAYHARAAVDVAGYSQSVGGTAGNTG